MDVQEVEIKTFKEVHAELENEHMLLQKNHDVQDFENKSSFLKLAGFSNSIATRLYEAISSSVENVKEIHRKYNGQYKFILEPQLERVCEKYNLFVRDVNDFVADIPEKNIKDIMNFQVYVSDLPEHLHNFFEHHQSIFKKEVYQMFDSRPNLNKKVSLSDIGRVEARILQKYKDYVPTLQIAAVRNMFSPEAFSESEARIINLRPERSPRFKVNLDPIVLCNTKYKGRIIVTAWGDESNDELVVNQHRN